MKYSYSGLAWVLVKAWAMIGVVGLVGSTALCLGVPIMAGIEDGFREGLNVGILFLYGLLTDWSIFSIPLNACPDVWADDDFITISAFLFIRIRIPWQYVVDIRQSQRFPHYRIVRTRRISFFHRLIGLIYGTTILPSFLIRPEIDGYNTLLALIVEKTQAHGSGRKGGPG